MPRSQHQCFPLVVGGVMPRLAMVAGLGPPRSECGPGALMAWADRLWCVTYVSSGQRSGLGTGLYEIDEDFVLRKHPKSVVGTFANRMVHFPTNQLVIGPHVIDERRRVRTFEGLLPYRIAATMAHLIDPGNKVYFLGMEGHFFEADLHTLEVKQLFDLTKELRLPESCQPHFKTGFTFRGRVIVANNTYDEQEFLGQRSAGRLAEWDGSKWSVISSSPFNEVFGRQRLGGGAAFATGWDRASALMMVLSKYKWTTYRLPKASHTNDHYWATEWPRIRELEHERFLMDCHGMFYELSPHAFGGRVWGVRPISSHLWVVPDFCAWRGMIVLGFNQNTSAGGDNCLAGEPNAGLWFGKYEDLWQFGKPSGWGGPWWKQTVRGGDASDPYLMTGFDKKVMHLANESKEKVEFAVEVDFLGDGSWKVYDTFNVSARGYVHHEFPSGYSAHWVRVRADRDCVATAYFTYT